MSRKGNKDIQSARRIGDAYLIATILPAAIGIGYGMGWVLDWFFSSTPWCTYIFTGLGVIAGFMEAIRTALRVGREEDRAVRPNGEGTGDGEQGTGPHPTGRDPEGRQ
ncbi:MAG: AtpZ/AtpI family protein [Acidobacteria bacterium]|nr:AtpZ/AtpI family protein [Acidobacteriota bacterium]